MYLMQIAGKHCSFLERRFNEVWPRLLFSKVDKVVRSHGMLLLALSLTTVESELCCSLTIIRRRRSDYRCIFTETKSR